MSIDATCFIELEDNDKRGYSESTRYEHDAAAHGPRTQDACEMTCDDSLLSIQWPGPEEVIAAHLRDKPSLATEKQ
jgi:hypothetical protein